MATTIPARLIGTETGLLNRPAHDILILNTNWRVTGTLG
jgi:hypothetical protein